MKILSIETSCDETGISIMEVHPAKGGARGGIKNASFKVLANNVSSQIDVHVPFGGVYPALAKREHIKNLPIVLEKTLKEAKLGDSVTKSRPVDLIAVTKGPGLEIALWTGIVFAKELAKKWGVPLIGTDHMEGHIFSSFGKANGSFKIPKIDKPTMALLVSGGHTELVLIKKPARTTVQSGGWMDYEVIGETVDDAVGEAFDKVARMLELPYPGGPQISKLAKEARLSHKGIITQVDSTKKSGFSLPRPMLHSKNFDFSFSGLKTAVLYLIRDLGGIKKINEETKKEIAMEFENAAIQSLVHKTEKAIEKYKIKNLIVAGGVSANDYLKSEIKRITKRKVKIFFPKKELTGDNSIMIGIAGYLNYIKNKKKIPKAESIKADGNLRL